MQEFKSFLLAVLLYAGTTALGIVGYLYAGTIDHPGLGLDVFGAFALVVLYLIGLRYILITLADGIYEQIAWSKYRKGRVQK